MESFVGTFGWDWHSIVDKAAIERSAFNGEKLEREEGEDGKK